MRYDMKDTILAKNLFKCETLNDKKNEILRRLEIFVSNYHCMPKQVLLSYDTFIELQNNNSDLLREIDEQYYLLCMKIVF